MSKGTNQQAILTYGTQGCTPTSLLASRSTHSWLWCCRLASSSPLSCFTVGDFSRCTCSLLTVAQSSPNSPSDSHHSVRASRVCEKHGVGRIGRSLQYQTCTIRRQSLNMARCAQQFSGFLIDARAIRTCAPWWSQLAAKVYRTHVAHETSGTRQDCEAIDCRVLSAGLVTASHDRANLPYCGGCRLCN
jgi:hypothetical protein